MEKKCQCGGNLEQGEFVSFSSISIPNGYNSPKTYSIIPFVCEKCGKIEFYAGENKNGNFMFGGMIIG